MVRKALIFSVVILLLGCAHAATKHQQRLAALDAQYKSGQIDAIQYQAKYSAEVEDYKFKRGMAVNMLH